MKVTLNDLAAHTGLSKSTISRVITGAGPVSEGTKEIVERAIADTGYAKKKGKAANDVFCNMILAISRDLRQEPHIRYIKALSNFFFPKGYMVCALDCNANAETELAYLKYASAHGFLGVFLLSYIGYPEISDAIKKLTCPIILLNHYPKSLDLDVVSIDNYHAGTKAGYYLLERGHRKVALLCGPDRSVTSRNRLWGILDAFQDYGIDFPQENIIRTDLSYQAGYDFGMQLAQERRGISAVFSVNRLMADAVIDALHHSRLSVPGDISVICTDNIPPPISGRVQITTICHDDTAMALAAGELLLERIQNPNSAKKNISYSPMLVEGNSVSALQSQ